MLGQILGGYAASAKTLDEANYLEDMLAAIAVTPMATSALSAQIPWVVKKSNLALANPGNLQSLMLGALTPNQWTAPFLEKAGLSQGDPSRLPQGLLSPQNLGLGGLQESLSGKIPTLMDKPMSETIGFDRGGELPEDILGRGPSGREYYLRAGETVLPTQGGSILGPQGGYDRMGALGAAGAPVDASLAAQVPNSQQSILGPPNSSPEGGKGILGLFRDPSFQHMLGKFGAAISPQGSAQQQLGATVAELAKQKAASDYLKQKQTELMTKLGVPQKEKGTGKAGQQQGQGQAGPAPISMPPIFSTQEAGQLQRTAQQNILGALQYQAAQQGILGAQTRQAYTEQLTQESQARMGRAAQPAAPTMREHTSLGPDNELHNYRDYIGDGVVIEREDLGRAKAPDRGPPPTKNIGGRVKGWNPEAQAYTIDYGKADAEKVVTSIDALSKVTTIASRIMGQRYKDEGLTDWLTSAITSLLAGQEIEQPETAEYQDRWDEYLQLIEDITATNFPKHVTSIGTLMSRMRAMETAVKPPGETPTPEQMRKNPARYREGDIDGQVSFRDMETNVIHIVPSR